MKTFFKSKKAMFLGALAIFTLGNVSGVSASTTLKEITAYLDGGIRLVVNGLPFTAKDSDGKVLTPINYEGNTYLPLRSVAEATGMNVKWDDVTRTATLGALGNQEAQSHVEISSDKSFEFTLPGTWIRTDDNGVDKQNPEIKYGAINNKADVPIYMGVIPESKSVYLDTTRLEDYKKIIIDQMNSKDGFTNTKQSSVIDFTLNGSPAKQLVLQGIFSNSINVSFLVTFVETNNRFYQIIFWTTDKQMVASRDDLTEIISTFKEIKK
ncbi:stalk domain-containing protein [Paenibacillus sp. 2RAB27]|uniref:stalk domain-containing protein n=1 Tax=Paenibacillus sp. 2RAB27 TaxID=3232991 RepID=UPI003F9AA732